MVAQDGEHEIVVDKSRFICHVKRVYNDQDAMEFIKEIKKIHWNATHNCSAYQVGDFNEIQKNPTAGSIRRAYFRNFENGYYGNRNYELEHIYNTI